MELKCDIISSISSPLIFYKVTWLHIENSSSISNALVKLDHTGLLSYPENQRLRNLQGRLRLSRPTWRSFSLGIERAHEEDSGTYQCQVEQYQLDQEGLWQQKASESSGLIKLAVKVAGKSTSLTALCMKLYKCGLHGCLRKQFNTLGNTLLNIKTTFTSVRYL